MTDDEVPIREVQTATVRQRKSQNANAIVVSLKPAIRAAGLEDGGSFEFEPAAADEFGMVPAFGSAKEGRVERNSLTRRILKEGNGGRRLHIPEKALEAIPGFPPVEEIDWDDPPELSVWAGDRMLAFELAESRSVTIDRSAGDGDEGEEEDEGSNQEDANG